MIIYKRFNDELHYDYTDAEGYDWGHIVTSGGEVLPSDRVESILSRGYWLPTPELLERQSIAR